jgi:hypothetical protein
LLRGVQIESLQNIRVIGRTGCARHRAAEATIQSYPFATLVTSLVP